MTSCKEGKGGKTVFETRSPYDLSSENFCKFFSLRFSADREDAGRARTQAVAAGFESVNLFG
jgi:hypothetical protein